MKRYRNEWKYLEPGSVFSIVKEKVGRILEKDENSGSQGAYMIHSLYFDDLFDSCARENKSGESIRFKYRIRYYNNNTDFLRLEKKEKMDSLCYKKSCLIDRDKYFRILRGEVEEMVFSEKEPLLREFCGDIINRGFSPKVIVDYRREAFVERITNIRITFDSCITASSEFESFLDSDYEGISVINPLREVMEVKFDDILPAYINKVLSVSTLNRQAFSKYYMSRQRLTDVHRYASQTCRLTCSASR